MVTRSCTYDPTPVSSTADIRPAPPPSAPLPETLRGLLRPGAYPHPVQQVELLATHMSWVLLAGEFAYKIKRPVRFPFADFTDPAHRAALCAEEIRLNRRFAPGLYLGTVQVHLADGAARIGGDGPVLETAVRMRQFDRRDELDARVAAGTVGTAEFADFGARLAAIHASLPPLTPAATPSTPSRAAPSLLATSDPLPSQPSSPPPLRHPAASRAPGDPRLVATVLRRNYAELLRLTAATDDAMTGEHAHGDPTRVRAPATLRDLRHALSRALRRARPALAKRAAAGAIRECHGDLHLSNLVMLDGRITAFDALEFEPAFRCIDVADEVAFLWADLAGHGRRDLAHAFLAAYLEASGDYGLLQVLDLYVAHRALVRAKIMAIRGSSVAPTTAGVNATLRARRDTYVALAARALRAPESLPRPRLLLLHGLSGSGKTWLARRLAPRLEAIHLRSDVERKRLAGLAPLASSASDPGAGLYSSAASERTYEHLAKQARTILRSGRSVVCDAAFLSRASRAALRAAAAGGIADLVVVHCTAPDAELRRRLRARQTAGNDASEADAAVLDWQLRHVEPLQPTECDVVVEVDTTAADPLGATLRALGDAAA